MKKILVYLGIIIGFCAVFFGVVTFFGSQGSMAAQFGVSKKDWQAVHMINGNVYFGHINRMKSNFVELKDVYYIKLRTAYQEQKKNDDKKDGKTKSDDESNTVPVTMRTLAKPASEMPSPEDRMIINRDHILYWEKLMPDSQIVQTIERFKKTGQ